MRIKILETGWDRFNGDIGGIQFEGGVSVETISRPDADRLSAVMRCELIDAGEFKPVTEAMIDRNQPAPNSTVLTPKPESELDAERQALNAKAVGLPQRIWSQNDLEALADEKGIVGLRDAAAPLGVKDRSISGIIKEIMAEQMRLVSLWEKASGKQFVWPGQTVNPSTDDETITVDAEAVAAAFVAVAEVVAVAETEGADEDEGVDVNTPLVAEEQAAAEAEAENQAEIDAEAEQPAEA